MPIDPVSQVLTKRAGESRLYDFDFSKQTEVAAGQTLTGSPTITATPVGLTVGAAALSSPRVQAQISGGVAGVEYTVTATAATSGGATLEEVGTLRVV